MQSYDNWLTCPHCGGTHLHHQQVTVYSRPGEDGPSYAVRVQDATVEWATPVNGNPSARRGGVAILFRCEDCAVMHELALAQHKGTTYLEWRLFEVDVSMPACDE